MNANQIENSLKNGAQPTFSNTSTHLIIHRGNLGTTLLSLTPIAPLIIRYGASDLAYKLTAKLEEAGYNLFAKNTRTRDEDHLALINHLLNLPKQTKNKEKREEEAFNKIYAYLTGGGRDTVISRLIACGSEKISSLVFHTVTTDRIVKALDNVRDSGDATAYHTALYNTVLAFTDDDARNNHIELMRRISELDLNRVGTYHEKAGDSFGNDIPRYVFDQYFESRNIYNGDLTDEEMFDLVACPHIAPHHREAMYNLIVERNIHGIRENFPTEELRRKFFDLGQTS